MNTLSPPQLSRSGFTLLEVLVASTVSLILIGLILSVTFGVLESYQDTSNGTVQEGDAALALDQMIQDLEGLVVPNLLGSEALRATPEKIGPHEADAQWLTLLSTSTDEDQSEPVTFTGASRSISYRIAYQNPIDGSDENATYGLYRSIASAEHTFDNAIGSSNLQNEYWDNLAATPNPTPRSPTDLDNFLASNVVRFQLRFQYLDTKGNDNPSDDELVWTSPEETLRFARSGLTIIDGGASLSIPTYERVEVLLTVLTPEGMERLRSGVVGLEEAIQRYGQTSVRQAALF